MKVIFIAYKIAANTGSEDGSGYECFKYLYEKYKSDLVVVTRENNLANLQSDGELGNCNFLAIELPKYARFYKRKSRGVILYYYLWQIFAAYRVKSKFRLSREEYIVWIYNFHCDWAPHFFRRSDGFNRIIWGPILHHPLVPQQLFSSRKRLFQDRIRAVVKSIFWNFDINLERSRTNSDLIIYGNNNIPKPFLRHKEKILIRPYANSFLKLKHKISKSSDFTVLFIGRATELKGIKIYFEVARQFLETDSDINFKFVGGTEEDVKTLGFNAPSNVKFIRWLPQHLIEDIYYDSDLLLYPSFESQGLVVAEALSTGLSTLTLKNTGPNIVARGHGLEIDFSENLIELSENIKSMILNYKITSCYDDDVEYLRRRRLRAANFNRENSWKITINSFLEHFESFN